MNTSLGHQAPQLNETHVQKQRQMLEKHLSFSGSQSEAFTLNWHHQNSSALLTTVPAKVYRDSNELVDDTQGNCNADPLSILTLVCCREKHSPRVLPSLYKNVANEESPKTKSVGFNVLPPISLEHRSDSGELDTDVVSASLPQPQRRQSIKFDTWVPPITDVYTLVLQMRQKLGWPSELPRIGPGYRKKLQQCFREEAARILHVSEHEVNDMTKEKRDLTNDEAVAYQRVKQQLLMRSYGGDDGTFYYCLLRSRNDGRALYNPYDLEAVSASEALHQISGYWTISVSTLSRVTYVQTEGNGVFLVPLNQQREEVETIPILQWLWERTLYDRIIHLDLFQKFRKWRAFKIWHANVRHKQKFTYGVSLSRRLFVGNEILQGCLLHIQAMCDRAAYGNSIEEGHPLSVSGLPPTLPKKVHFITVNKSTCFTMSAFEELQSGTIRLAKRQLMQLRLHVLDLVLQSCQTVCDMEGVSRGLTKIQTGSLEAIHDSINQLHQLTSSFNPLGTAAFDRQGLSKSDRGSRVSLFEIPKSANESPSRSNLLSMSSLSMTKDSVASVTNEFSKPTYAERAQWKKVLSRLMDFVRLVDCHLLRVYHHVMFSSIEFLDEWNSDAYNTGLQLREKEKLEQMAQKLQTTKLTGQVVPVSGEPLKCNSDTSEDVLDIDKILADIRRQQRPMIITKPMFEIVLHLEFSNTLETSSDSMKETEEQVDPNGKKIVIFTPDGNVARPGLDESSPPISDEEDEEVEGASSSTTSYSSEEEEEEGVLPSIRTSANLSTQRKSISENSPVTPVMLKTQPINKSKKSKKRMKSQHKKRSEIAISPKWSEWNAMFKQLFQSMESVFESLPSLLQEPSVLHYHPRQFDAVLALSEKQASMKAEISNETSQNAEASNALHPQWPNVDLMFRTDPNYQNIRDSIFVRLKRAYQSVKKHASLSRPICKMVDRAQMAMNSIEQGSQSWTTEDFHRLLSEFTEQVRTINQVEERVRLDLYLIRSDAFMQECLPYPNKIITDVQQRLADLSGVKNEDFLQVVRNSVQRLDVSPETVEEFVDHLGFLNKMVNELPALEKEYHIINRLFTISKDFDVTMPPESLALYKILGPTFQHLRNSIIYHEAKKEENLNRFTKDLETLIETIHDRVIELKMQVLQGSFLNSATLARTALETIIGMQEEVNRLNQRVQSYSTYQGRFGSQASQPSAFQRARFSDAMDLSRRAGKEITVSAVQQILGELERDLTLRRLLWESIQDWQKFYDDCTMYSFPELNVDQVQRTVNKFSQTVFMLEKGLPANDLLPMLKKNVADFRHSMPVIVALRNPTLQPRHWIQMEALLGRTILKDKNFTLGDLMELNIMKYKDKIQEISTTASNESVLEVMIKRIKELWSTTDFRLVPHPGRDTYITIQNDDLSAQLEESQMSIATIKGSRYVAPVRQQVEDWERKLSLLSRVLQEWLQCQRLWLYLERIFSTPDIQRQLANETRSFNQVDKQWRDLMQRVHDRPNAIKASTSQGVLQTLQTSNEALSAIQKSLEDYLESKRLLFARFYFLGNDELLEILAQSQDPNSVQPHLGKLFQNIKSLDIQLLPKQPPTVVSIRSGEGEVLLMPKNIRARGNVEQWLIGVEQGMFDAVKKHMKNAMMEYVMKDYSSWIAEQPGQVIIAVEQIMFNKRVCSTLLSTSGEIQFGHEKLDEGDAPQEISKRQAPQFKTLKELQQHETSLLNILTEMVTLPLAEHNRMALEAKLTLSVNNRDVVANLVENGVKELNDFHWAKQLRYDWDESKNQCMVRQVNAVFPYGYEYLGCSPRLVITPLTDRCYLTLTGAHSLHLGGSPSGPAGTGKSETVKDLAKALGTLCIVFNCSEAMNYRILEKIFSGLAQTGSWACLDEFNRIDIEVLSVVASQLQTIKSAKASRALRFHFEGRDMKMNAQCGIFITMNPTYRGRVQLPDNLKSFFRPIAMMVPDNALIAEIVLFSVGFVHAYEWSGKIVKLYQLANTQLSQQNHYDFGLRAIKSVLLIAGRKRIEFASSRRLTKDEEAQLLIQSIRESNLPRFVAQDVAIFKVILSDLFPGITSLPTHDHVYDAALRQTTQDLGLQYWANQAQKVHQLHMQLLVRHGVMLVGPTGGGKTSVRNILQRLLVLLPGAALETFTDPITGEVRRDLKFYRHRKGQVDSVQLFSKSLELHELYGQYNPQTMEWQDGLLGHYMRRFIQSQHNAELTLHGSHSLAESSTGWKHDIRDAGSSTASSSRRPSVVGVDHKNKMATTAGTSHGEGARKLWQWIIFDGPVDTHWVENLNTALDESRILCLPNGERIGLTNATRFLFEVDSLQSASPATVSRCAMVYLDPVQLGWQPLVSSWLQTKLPSSLPAAGRDHLDSLFRHSIGRGLSFVHAHRRQQPVYVPELAMVQTVCSLVECFLHFMEESGGFGYKDSPTNPAKSSGVPPTANATTQQTNPSSSKRRGSSSKGQATTSNRGEAANNFMQESEQELTCNTLRPDGRQYYLQKQPKQLTNLLGKLFVFAFTWGFGGNLRHEEPPSEAPQKPINSSGKTPRQWVSVVDEFDQLVRDVFDIEPPLGVRLPSSSHTIFDYFVDLESGNFNLWENLVPSTQSLIQSGVSMTLGAGGEGNSSRSSLLRAISDKDVIQSIDTLRFSFLCGLLLAKQQPTLLLGDTGVGKSVILRSVLHRIESEGGISYGPGTLLGSVLNYSDRNQALVYSIQGMSTSTDIDEDAFTGESNADSKVEGENSALAKRSKPPSTQIIIANSFDLSAQSGVKLAQQQCLRQMVKRGRDTLGAPKNKKLLIFIDDAGMPLPDHAGSQPPLEFVRQLVENGGFHDSVGLCWKSLVDSTISMACGPSSARGKFPVSMRLISKFSVLTVSEPSSRSLHHIYKVQLGRFLHEANFSQEVRDLLNPLMQCCITLYHRIRSAMRPTPYKIHYTFNLRDLTKTVRGLFQAHEKVVIGRDDCAHLLVHEVSRVFCDRLCDMNDRQMFYMILAEELHNSFKVTWSAETLQSRPRIYSYFTDQLSGVSEPTYRPTDNVEKLAQAISDLYMKKHVEDSAANMSVYFKDAVHHISRVCRMLHQPRGHMLLVGLDGTGKSTTVNIAAFLCECELHRPKLTSTYSHADFRTDLKHVVERAGVGGRKCVFLLTDSELQMRGMAGGGGISEATALGILEDVNYLLNRGEVPGLFDGDELDAVLMNLNKEAANAGRAENREQILQFFIERVQQNLHLVLCMSSVDEGFRFRCRYNPAIINCCTMDWFSEWSPSDMLQLADHYLLHDDLLQFDEERERVAVVSQLCVDIHNTAIHTSADFNKFTGRHCYLTPSGFIEFLRLLSKILLQNRHSIEGSVDRLRNGLIQLDKTNRLISVMQDELVALGPQIDANAKETDELLVKLTRDQAAVEEVRQLVLHEEDVMRSETRVVEDYAKECESDLASVVPTLQQAIVAVYSLDKACISEVRVYQNPPLLVSNIMCAVCVLLGVQPTWKHAKLLLADTNFANRLMSIDLNNLNHRIFQKVRQYTNHPDFNPDQAQKVSSACRSICEWVLAMVNYYDVHEMVKPKQRRVAEAQEALGLAKNKLEKNQNQLKRVEEHLKKLQDRYQFSEDVREELKKKKEITGQRLVRAGLLIKALEGEKERWEKSLHQLSEERKLVIGKALLVSASVAYLGSLTASYRSRLLSVWMALLEKASVSVHLEDGKSRRELQEADFVSFQFSPNTILHWHNVGLPYDSHSVQNAAIINLSRRCCFVVDPQAQAVKFLQGMEESRLKIVSCQSGGYLQYVERGARVGDPLLLTDVADTPDPILNPIFRKEIRNESGKFIVRIGDSLVEYNDRFRLYLSTSKANPRFLPRVNILTTIVNFSVNAEGLEEQLLSVVVRQEKPELEEARTQLLIQLDSSRQELRNLEDRILGLLQSTTETILDDEALPSTLKDSKHMARDIGQRVSSMEETERALSAARRSYSSVARRAVLVYFTINSLSSVNIMYQFSLVWYEQLFQHTIFKVRQEINESGLTDMQPPAVSEAMSTAVTQRFHELVSPALFYKHQLLFNFMLSVATVSHRGVICDSHGTASNSVKGNSVEDEKAMISPSLWETFLYGNHQYQGIAKAGTAAGGTVDSKLDTMQQKRKELLGYLTSWLGDEIVNACDWLEAKFSSFHGLLQHLCDHRNTWTTWVETKQVTYSADSMGNRSNPLTTMQQFQEETLTEHEERIWKTENLRLSSLSVFELLILVKILMPAHLVTCIREFVRQILGDVYLSIDSSNLRRVFERASANEPVVLILGQGADPTESLMRLAREIRNSTLHLNIVSLGAGQGEKVMELIKKAQILKGRWIYLQNCHLATTWMPRLEEWLNKAQAEKSEVDPNFRLFLSSKPDHKFPMAILHKSVKLAVESPRGIKGILLRTFAEDRTGSVNPSEFSTSSPELKQLIFSLCLFNAVTLERRKYGSLGFNYSYEFSNSDLEVALLFLRQFPWTTSGARNDSSSSTRNIPIHQWTAIHDLIGEITYGGRVIDDWDRRCLMHLLCKYVNSDILQWSDERPFVSFAKDELGNDVLRSLRTEERLGLIQETNDEGSVLVPKHEASFTLTYRLIQSLPDADPTEAFGMARGAENSSLLERAREFMVMIDNVTTGSADPTDSDSSRQGMSLTTGIFTNANSNLTESDARVLQILNEITNQLPRQVEAGIMDDEDFTKWFGSRMTLNEAWNNDETWLEEANKNFTAYFESHVLEHYEKDIAEDAMSVKPPEAFFRFAMHNVLRQEVHRYDQMLSVIHKSSRHLSQAIDGRKVMSEALEQIYIALLNNRIPETWRHYDTCKTLSTWFHDLKQRLKFFADWTNNLLQGYLIEVWRRRGDYTSLNILPSTSVQNTTTGPSATSNTNPSTSDDKSVRRKMSLAKVPEMQIRALQWKEIHSYWLPAFILPQAFLTAILQDHCRQHMISIDALALHFEVSKTKVKSNVEEDISQNEEAQDTIEHEPQVDSSRMVSSSPRSHENYEVYGLSLDSACWNELENYLTVNDDRERFSPLPSLLVRAVHKQDKTVRSTSSFSLSETLASAEDIEGVEHEDDVSKVVQKEKHAHSYECPVYRTVQRAGVLSSTGLSSNFVCAIDLPTREPSQFWSLRGTALLTEIDLP